MYLSCQSHEVYRFPELFFQEGMNFLSLHNQISEEENICIALCFLIHLSLHHKLVDLEGNLLTFHGKQGEAMGRPGIVQVSVLHENGEPKTVKIGGHAVVAFQGEIFI